ncbi:hydroxymethylglutaryl-CoA reductase, degradative [Enterococcus timonensis]|uniref:hydroxymethylglutaryl-CoA reductase, degradative n=1 Tax=Enterococcus timonensis TaxID=1852364 RepID=UPI000AD0DA96|nr:hydroxymethylglutaryl-CoA reductase, degradative [Enterococcus timonensis]
MNEVVILDALRTPIGKFRGSLAEMSAVDLGVSVTKQIIKQNQLATPYIEHVYFGNVLQAGNGQNPARQIALNSGLKENVVATTINQVCGSGLKSILLARQMIQLNEAQVVLAGGVENMSQAPTIKSKNPENNEQEISILLNDGLTDAFSKKHMGLTAENVAEKFGITRAAQDNFALKSQLKAAAAQKKNLFAPEISPVTLSNGTIVTQDESIRPKTTLEKLSTLKPAFKNSGTVTPGNASTINDGAAAVLLASKSFADAHHLPYLAVIEDAVEVGIDPSLMGISPIDAIEKLLTRQKLSVHDIDLFEINEAFAATSLVVEQQLKLDSAKVNLYGGGISLGHAIGATGSRLVTTLCHQLETQQKKLGIAALCVGGGLGLAILLKRPEKNENQPEKKFYQLTANQRLDQLELDAATYQEFTKMSLPPEVAENLIENQISEIELPLGVVRNFSVNNKNYDVPMATEEPSVVAALNSASKIIKNFTSTSEQSLKLGQIIFQNVSAQESFINQLKQHQAEIFISANDSMPSMVSRGGGLKGILPRLLPENFVSLDLFFDTKNAMGANVINSSLEKIAAQLKIIFPTADILMAILSNFTTESLVTATCRLDFTQLDSDPAMGEKIAKKIVAASHYASLDAYRAVTNNKGIANGIDALMLATGNDTRQVAANLHAFASEEGRYQSVSQWEIQQQQLVGTLIIPLAVATVGGATHVLPKAKAAWALLKITDAAEFSELAAAVGLAQNFSALKAIVTKGIQHGHMHLQASALALSVGATGKEITELTDLLQSAKIFNQTTALEMLKKLRATKKD